MPSIALHWQPSLKLPPAAADVEGRDAQQWVAMNTKWLLHVLVLLDHPLAWCFLDHLFVQSQDPTREQRVPIRPHRATETPMKEALTAIQLLSSLSTLLPQLLHQGSLQIHIQRCLFPFVDVDRHITHIHYLIYL